MDHQTGMGIFKGNFQEPFDVLEKNILKSQKNFVEYFLQMADSDG